MTNLPSSFWDEAYKVTAKEGSILKSKIDQIVKNGDPSGNITEEIIDLIFKDQGYKLGDGKYFGGGNNGLDRVYYKGNIDNPSEMIIFEAKQMQPNGTVKLNDGDATTLLPVQMSDPWIRYIAVNKLSGETILLRQQTGNAIITFGESNIHKYIVAVDKSNGQINFLKLGR